MKHLLIILFIGILFSKDKSSEIDKRMNYYFDSGKFNGSILVAHGNKIIIKKGYGLANMEWNIPNRSSTVFLLGSITKQFTSMIIMQLFQEGKIQLEDNISKYLPNYRSDIGKKVTINHLLNHTSGIPNYTSRANFFKDFSHNSYTVDEFVKLFCSNELEFEPGEKYSYNNSGYYLLGAIIESLTKKKFETVLQEKILDPLNMNNSGYHHHERIVESRATGYQKKGNTHIKSKYINMSVAYTAGAMYSTTEDLYLWNQALYTENLLLEKNKNIMFKPFLHDYAYGWRVSKILPPKSKDSLNIVSHGGGINGFNSLITRLVDDKYFIILLDNKSGNGPWNLEDIKRINLDIINILYGKPD